MLADKLLECISIKPVSFEELLEVFRPSSVDAFREALKRLMINERIKIEQIGSSMYYVLTKEEQESGSGSGRGTPGLRMNPPQGLNMPSEAAQSLGVVSLGKFRERKVSEQAVMSHADWKKALDEGTEDWQEKQSEIKKAKMKK